MKEKKLCMMCFLCDKTPKRNYTAYWCKTCETPLCLINCYDKHRKKKFLDD